MQKPKPLTIRHPLAIRGRIKKVDDGVLAIPTPPEDRTQSHVDMQAFISRYKEQERNQQLQK